MLGSNHTQLPVNGHQSQSWGLTIPNSLYMAYPILEGTYRFIYIYIYICICEYICKDAQCFPVVFVLCCVVLPPPWCLLKRLLMATLASDGLCSKQCTCTLNKHVKDFIIVICLYKIGFDCTRLWTALYLTCIRGTLHPSIRPYRDTRWATIHGVAFWTLNPRLAENTRCVHAANKLGIGERHRASRMLRILCTQVSLDGHSNPQSQTPPPYVSTLQ